MKRFDDDAVGADLRVRPDAEVDVSGQPHRSAPTVSSLVAKRRMTFKYLFKILEHSKSIVFYSSYKSSSCISD